MKKQASEYVELNDKLENTIKSLIKSSICFKEHTGKNPGTTGLIGEYLVCKALKLNWIVDDLKKGYDAEVNDAGDFQSTRYQIKSRLIINGKVNGETNKLNVSEFNFLLLCLLDENDYSIKELYKIPSTELCLNRQKSIPINKLRIESQKVILG